MNMTDDSAMNTIAATRGPANAWAIGQGRRYPSADGAVVPAAVGEAVYAYGTIQARFPSLSVEKEFFQSVNINHLLPDAEKGIYQSVSNASDLKRLNELINAKNSLYKVLSQLDQSGEVLSQPDQSDHLNNLYLAREMCWVLQSRRDQPLYLLDIANDARLAELVRLLKVDGAGKKASIIAVGQARPLASNWACNGINAPVAALLSLTPVNPEGFCQTLQSQINGLDASKCALIVSQLLTLTDNAGRTDEQRALNYALLNYLKIYQLAYSLLYGGGMDCCGRPLAGEGGYRLDGVRTEPAQGSGRLVKLLFSFTGNQPGMRQLWYCVVNVSGNYPFIAEELTQTIPLG